MPNHCNNQLTLESGMKKEDIENFILESTSEDEEILLADGFEKAFVGIARQFGKPFAVYDRFKCIHILTDRDGMLLDEAEEYFQYNVEGAYVGENTPAFIEMLKFNKHLK